MSDLQTASSPDSASRQRSGRGKAVYVMSMGERRTKIGISNDPERRRRGMATGCPEPLRVEAEFSSLAPAELESRALKVMAASRLSGEWVDAPAVLVMAVVHHLNVDEPSEAGSLADAWARMRPLYERITAVGGKSTWEERRRFVDLGYPLAARGLLPTDIAKMVGLLSQASGVIPEGARHA